MCRVRPSASAPLLAALVTACADNPAAPAAPAILWVTVEAPASPLVRTLDLQLAEPARVQATYWADGVQPLRVTTSQRAERHALVLARLHAERDYTVEVRALDPHGRAGAALHTTFRTDPLPADLAALRFEASGQATYSLTVIEITRGTGFLGVVAIDDAGRVVWFHRTNGPVNGMIRRSDGTFAMIDEARGLLLVSPDGRMLAGVAQDSANRRIHHDVIETASGTLLFLAQDWKPTGDTMVAGESIWEWHPESGALQKRWSAWDHLDPLRDWGPLSHPNDWLHANSLARGPRGNLIVSLHFLNQVLSIAPGYGALEWRLGGPGASIQVPAAERFSGQHTAAEIAPNRLLMFDNGFERVAERYSRAVEFALDPIAGHATRVWEWGPTPDQWSRIVSLVRRLPNGHTFVAFGSSAGLAGSTGPVAAYEVTPAGTVAWQTIVEGVPLMYRAWPLGDIAGETPASNLAR